MSSFPEKASAPVVYCFDFDGVLCDSMDESLITSFNAYFDRNARSVSEIDPILRDFFYRHRHMVRPAEEYFIIYHAFEKGETNLGKDRFLRFKAEFPDEMRDHAERFYHQRECLQKNMDYWLGLHKLYPQCVSFLEKRTNPFYIVSNKDKDSIVSLSRHHGYSHRIIDIYSREIATKKRVLLEMLIKDHGLNTAADRIIFVDDHEGTLGELEGLPLDLYLAAWGYTRKDDLSSLRLIHALDELPR